MNIFNDIELNSVKDFYIKKLINTWIKYKKIIICVDFDQTILPYEGFEYKLCENVVDTIKMAQNLGAYLILYICRDDECLNQALKYCNSVGLKFDDINPTKPFQEGYSLKPMYNILLDDKAGLPYTLDILQEAIKGYRKYLGVDPVYGALI